LEVWRAETLLPRNLDKNWIKVGLELVVRANEGQLSERNVVKVGAPSGFTMYTLPFYLFGLDETDIPLSQTAVPDKATQDEYFAKHPFAKLTMLNHPAGKIVWPYIIVEPREGRVAQKVTYKEQQGDPYAVMSAVFDTLHAIRGANGDAPLNHKFSLKCASCRIPMRFIMAIERACRGSVIP
jgi:hypothetical protein